MKHKNELMWAQPLVTLAILLIFCLISTTPAQTVPEIAEKALAATVYLEMKDSNGLPLGFGSGFFVRENLITTNYHVIDGAMSGTAKLVGKSITYTIEGVAATDKINNLAILKVTANAIKPLPLGDSNIVRIGEAVYVVGNSKGMGGTFSNGIISSRRAKYTQEPFQVTAPISPGSSGGPVLNSKGKVIGISFMTLRDGQNLNFAIPVNILKELLGKSSTVIPFTHVDPIRFANIYLKWGKEKYRLGDYQNAIADYDMAIHLKSDHVDAYNNRGNAKYKLGQYDAAIADYDMAIHLKSDHVDAYNNRGNVKYKLGQYDAAIADYDTAIYLNPDHVDTYNNRGKAKHNLGQYDAAIANYNIAILLNSDYADAYNNRGRVKYKLGQYDAAIADYNIAILLKPYYADAYNNRGRVKYKLGQYDAAITDYDTAIRLKPYFTQAYIRRGLVKEKLGQCNAAIADYDIAIRLKPDFTQAYIRRGFVKEKLGQRNAAIADYDIAIRLKPDYAFAYYNRGSVNVLLERTHKAKQDLRTALALAEKSGNKDIKILAEKALRALE